MPIAPRRPSAGPRGRPGRPDDPSRGRPLHALLAGADGARGGAVRAGAAVRAAVGERADRVLAAGPGPPRADPAQPHRLPAAGPRRHLHLRGRPAGAGGRPVGRSCWPPSHRNGPSPATRAWWSRPATTVVQVRAMGRMLVDDPLAGACTYTISGTSRGGRSTRAPPRTRSTPRCPTSRRWPARTTPCSPSPATAPS